MLKGSSPTARLDAALLLEHATGHARAEQIVRGDSAVAPQQHERFAQLCSRRASGVPIAYLTGRAWFYGREFIVDERVLVPRPETEHLVEAALAFAASRGALAIFEAGVGSGIIACTIAAELPHAQVVGTEASADALAVARENARRLSVNTRCRFACSSGAPPGAPEQYDMIVANLPYIPTVEVPRRPSPAAFEPVTALDGGPDGLDAYRTLLHWVPPRLRRPGVMLLETAPPVAPELYQLVAHALPGARLDYVRDYAGHVRVLRAETA